MRNRSENLLKYAAPEASRRYTHYLFRYPAKFHPPVARALLERYTDLGDCVLDCFCGSGTLLVEATVAGRSAVGSDVDPVAAFVSRVKARPLDSERLRRLWTRLEARLQPLERAAADYDGLQWHDIDENAYSKEMRRLAVPAIPNLFHWFLRYVLVDLARIKNEIDGLSASKAERDFFLLCFDPATRSARFANAGHPPPLLLRADRSATFLEGGRSVPLGVLEDAAHDEVEVSIEPGSTILLYTDGLVERRGASIDDGFDGLIETATRGPDDVDDLLSHVVVELVGKERSVDDVALVALKVLAGHAEGTAVSTATEAEHDDRRTPSPRAGPGEDSTR